MKGRYGSSLNCLAHRARNDNPARRCFSLQSCSHVHAIEVIAIDDQDAKMQAYTEDDGPVIRLAGVDVGHGRLELDGRAQGIYSAGKLRQCPVTRQLYHRPPWRAIANSGAKLQVYSSEWTRGSSTQNDGIEHGHQRIDPRALSATPA